MPWEEIIMDEETWLYVKKRAIEAGHPYPRAKKKG